MVNVIKENIDNIIKYANIVFLFVFSLHLCDFPDAYIVLWCMFSITLFWFCNKKLCLDKTFWILALAIVLNGLGTKYYLGESLGYTWKNIIKMVVPTVLVYPFMKQAVYNKKDIDIENILLAIALGTFAYSMLNYYAFVLHGFTNGRIWSEFWTDYPMNATHHSYWGCFIAGLIGYGMYCLYEKKWIKGISIIVFIVLENLIQIAVDNRMVLCITLLAMGVSLILLVSLNINNKKIIKNAFFITLVGIVVVLLIFALDVFGIRTSGYFQRFFTRDGGILNNIRFQMIYEAITLLPSHWKGGATMWTAGWFWVHNYWLQVANVSGIIPFVLWMIVNVAAGWDTVKVIRSPYICNQIKYMFIPMLASIVGYLMMEPGGTESNRYIIFYVILIALLKQLANGDKINVGEEDVQVSSEI